MNKVLAGFVLVALIVSSVAILGMAAPFKVAFVTPSTVNDSAWSQSMYDALVAIQNEMGEDNFQFVYSENSSLSPMRPRRYATTPARATTSSSRTGHSTVGRWSTSPPTFRTRRLPGVRRRTRSRIRESPTSSPISRFPSRADTLMECWRRSCRKAA